MNFIFDLYGTLVDIWTDEEKTELWEGVASLLGDGEENADAVREEYLSLCAAAHRGGYHEIDLLGVFEKMLSVRHVDTSVAPSLASEFRRLSMVRIAPFEGAANMLRELRAAGAGVYLLSNAQSCFTLDELSITGLSDLFDGIAISSDLGVKKPSPEAFRLAFERFGIGGEENVYVGNDLRDDVLGASSVGLKTVYIKTEQSGSYPELSLPEPTYTVATHREMRSLLLSLCGEG